MYQLCLYPNHYIPKGDKLPQLRSGIDMNLGRGNYCGNNMYHMYNDAGERPFADALPLAREGTISDTVPVHREDTACINSTSLKSQFWT